MYVQKYVEFTSPQTNSKRLKRVWVSYSGKYVAAAALVGPYYFNIYFETTKAYIKAFFTVGTYNIRRSFTGVKLINFHHVMDSVMCNYTRLHRDGIILGLVSSLTIAKRCLKRGRLHTILSVSL